MELKWLLISGVSIKLMYVLYKDISKINKYLKYLFYFKELKWIKIKDIKNSIINKQHILNIKSKGSKKVATLPLKVHISSKNLISSNINNNNKFIFLKNEYYKLNSLYLKKSNSYKMSIKFSPKIYFTDYKVNIKNMNKLNSDNSLVSYLNNYNLLQNWIMYKNKEVKFYKNNIFFNIYTWIMKIIQILLRFLKLGSLVDIFDISTGYIIKEKGVYNNQLVVLIAQIILDLETNKISLKKIKNICLEENLFNFENEIKQKIYKTSIHISKNLLFGISLYLFKNINTSLKIKKVKNFIKINNQLKCNNCDDISTYLNNKCKHLIFCENCYGKLIIKKCPVCSQDIEIEKIFI